MKASLYKERILLHGDAVIPEELSVHKRSFPICGDILRRLVAANPSLELNNMLKGKLRDICSKQEALKVIKSQTDTGGDSALYPYQRVGVEWLLRIKRGILTDEQGLGKTVMAASACRQLQGNYLNIGIICSSSNISNWIYHMKEFFRHGDSWARDIGVAGISHKEGSETHISNYDNIDSIKCDLDVLIVDEVHKVRNRKTKMFSAVRELAKRSRYVFLLTATPTVNADYDMWTLLNLCDPARFSSYWSYIFRFFSVSDDGFGMKIGDVKESERENLLRMISPYILHRDKSILNLPNISKRVVLYHLSDEHRTIYDQMENEWIVSLDNKSISADVKVAQITRLRQISISPELVLSGCGIYGKIDKLVEIIRENNKNTVVFTMFEEAAKLTKERLDSSSISCEIFTGSVSRRNRDILVRKFGSDFRVLVLTYGSGGEGLNLTQATCSIILDLPWHGAGYLHAIHRIYRIGQKDDVEITRIKSVDTIEEHIEGIIRTKGKMVVNDLVAIYKGKKK